MQALSNLYLAQLTAIQQTGVAQPEQSYYAPLQAFIAQASERLGHGHVNVIMQPQHQDYGVPDFLVHQGQQWIGCVEAKSLGGPLNQNTQQLRQYRAGIGNLLFTNFLNFKLFINGELLSEAELAPALGQPATAAAVDLVSQLLNQFFHHSVPLIENARQLASTLAIRARFLRQAVLDAMGLPPVQALHNAYQQFLFPAIADEDFADLVAQTIVYTLFAAWSQTPFPGFNVAAAAAHLPPNIPLLQILFTLTVNNPALVNTTIGLHISAVESILAATNPNILAVGVGEDIHQDVGEDPVMYFYQPFLHSYSKRTAEARGVYYTPIPAVRAMVRLADAVVVQAYGRNLGLAGPNVHLLDPATGTGTFLVQVGRKIIENIQAAGDANLTSQYLTQRFIPNTFGFEFLAASYTIAHLKLARFLHEEGGLEQFDRLRVYLTNTLQTPEFVAPPLPLLEALAAENQAATEVKTTRPLLVIIGNPPWSGHSENLNVQLSQMNIVEPFKWCDGTKVQQTKWLNNDYVKFLRWSQWRLTESEHLNAGNPEGLVVLITDNSYLTSPTFRGMRRYMLTQFDRIHLINLHGNIRTRAAGVPDDNIFDIQQGVCIAVLVRGGQVADLPEQPPENPVAHTPSHFLTIVLPGTDNDDAVNELMQQLSTAPIRASVTYLSSGTGTRSQKYSWLDNLDFGQLHNSTRLSPEPPFYFFAPFEMDAEYFSWPSVDELMPLGSMCVTTGDDTSRVFLSEDELASSAAGVHNPRRYHYRPFDLRWVNHTTEQLERPRLEVMQNLYQANVGLVTLKQTRRTGPYHYAFVTSDVTDKSCLSTEANCFLFPLYRYLGHEDQAAILPAGQPQRVANIRQELIERLSTDYGAPVTPEAVFYYTYAVLNAAGFLEHFQAQLPVESPHIPFVTGPAIFQNLSALGQRLADAHLGVNVPNLVIPFTDTGNAAIDTNALLHAPGLQFLQINSSGTGFGGITAEMWGYRVGTHRPLEDWLRPRNGRRFVLEYSDPADNPNPEATEILLDDYRSIIRRVAAAIPIHNAINEAWAEVP